MHIHARALKYFDMIRRCGSIREAARRLHVASSAVNRQLLQLEQEIGTPLFDRMPGGLRLTAAGEIFSRHVITVLQDEHRMTSELDALKGMRRGELSIASVEGLNIGLMPNVLSSMATRYPMLRLAARTTGSQQAAQLVADGDVDVGIGYGIERSEALRQYAVGRFLLGAIMSPEHPLAAQRTVTFAECARYPLILPGPGLSIHTQLRPILVHHRKPLTVLLESASVELAKSMALRGVGIAFQTRIGIEQELQDGRLVHVPLTAAGPVVSELGVYVRSGRSLPAALDAFIRVVAEELARRESGEPTLGDEHGRG
ncbi:LysR family transcriptional regulator [Stutzerimonas azotifigens]|uniref:LysR family transcriptional regulator n=1 Tax=Stutzerimonas azotifigens TaxID=291995 RepID=UPI000411E2EF|nr:LysR family transcriptional regulator [Stutzerimonas azotifigens]